MTAPRTPLRSWRRARRDRRTTRTRASPPAATAGAAVASGDLLVFLNPDATPRPASREAIRRPLAEGRGWAAWMGARHDATTAAASTRAATSSTSPGIAWAGEAGRPDRRGARSAARGRRSRRAPAWRCRAPAGASRRLPAGVLPVPRGRRPVAAAAARGRARRDRAGARGVDHDYEFAKGPAKWRCWSETAGRSSCAPIPAPLLALRRARAARDRAGALRGGDRGRLGPPEAARDAGRAPRAAAAAARAARDPGGPARSARASSRAHLTPDLSSRVPRPARAQPRWCVSALRAYWVVVRALLRVAG